MFHSSITGPAAAAQCCTSPITPPPIYLMNAAFAITLQRHRSTRPATSRRRRTRTHHAQDVVTGFSFVFTVNRIVLGIITLDMFAVLPVARRRYYRFAPRKFSPSARAGLSASRPALRHIILCAPSSSRTARRCKKPDAPAARGGHL